MKTEKLDQGDTKFINFFFDLFYRIHWNQNENGEKKEYFKTINTALLPTSTDINVLICGAGSCVHELPVLLMLFDKYEKVNLSFVDNAKEPFKLLDFILQKYGDPKCTIEKQEIVTYFNTQDHNIETDKIYSICDERIKYSFHVMDLELDPHKFVDSHELATTNRYADFNNYFKGKEYDIVMMSMFLQHISYWRSLIAFLNNHLKKGGYFWFNELGKDDYLLTWDLYMAIIDNKREKEKWIAIEKSLINYFESNKDKDQMLFSIISDNDEISPTNTEICRDFFDFFGSKGQVIFEEDFQSDIKPSELLKKAKEKFSPFTKLHSFIEGEALSPSFSEKESDVILDFTMKWYAYPQVMDDRLNHFNVLDENPTPLAIPVLQQYINRTLDILNLNSTIFRPTFLRSEDTSNRMVQSAISLFRRFQLFNIGNFQSIVFYIPGMTTFKCLNDTTKNYIDDFKRQKEFHDKIDKYNDAIKDTGVNNSALFFDKYKTMMTKPFSIFLEPLDQHDNQCKAPIKYEIDEYNHSLNQIVRIITVKGNQTDSQPNTTFDTPLGVSYNHSSLTALYEAFNVHFNNDSNKYRSILIPCFREPLFDRNKEFLGDLIIFQEQNEGYKDGTYDDTPIEFFSWLIRKFIDFTQIATYFDYRRIILQSLKSAIAAIMSRNLSHNLGSHYLYYTKKHLAELADNFDEKGPDIRGAAQVLGYIQARMDYLATIVAGEKYPYGSVYFKGQIFDELTIDDFSARHFKGIDNTTNKDRKYKRTTNYLLQNLVLSENFTRNPVVTQSPTNETEQQIGEQSLKTRVMHLLGIKDKNEQIAIGYSSEPKKEVVLASEKMKDNNKLIKIKVLWNGEPFTGASDDKTEKKEEAIKLALSKLCVALPGGIMSVHAFFNIVENMIRNSAKYLKEDFKEVDELVITIDIKEDNELIWNGNSIPSYTFTIFDNKWNAFNGIKTESEDNKQSKTQTLIEFMKGKLCYLSILTTENELEKSDKGLKEMLFSTLWMRAYTYEKSKKMSDVLFEIESKTGKEKLMEIKDHAFEYVAVDEKGQDVPEDNSLEKGNLGIRFSLPQYRMIKLINISDLSEERIKNTALNSFMDIICVQGEVKEGEREKLKKWFTRIYYDKDQRFSKNDENDMSSAIRAMEAVLERRFGKDFNKYRLIVGSKKEADGNSDKKNYGIYFVGHLEDKEESEYRKILDDYYYCESISGGNFTKTIETIFLDGTLTNGTYDKEKLDVKYFGLKVKEAALTRITLIDERFYNNMDKSDIERELMSCKNVRILNLRSKETVADNNGDLGVFDGNSFRDSSENKDHTHFLSIHLGMIEKIVVDEEYSKILKLDDRNIDREDVVDIKGKRAIALMELLKDMFNAEFISVHSGRGNFSKDLEIPLKEYQFISVSALESVLTNSKFLLAQLFYNTVYIGKGVANE